MIADKGYDNERVLETFKELGASSVIPPKFNRKVQREHDQELYNKGNLIERTFNKLKRFRRIVPPATIRRPYAPALFCTWRLPSCGSDSIVDSA